MCIRDRPVGISSFELVLPLLWEEFVHKRYWPGGKFLHKKEIIGKAYFRFWPLKNFGFFKNQALHESLSL